MNERSRGVALTIFAILFLLLAISNFLKPVLENAQTGFVFFGTRLSGAADMVVAPVFGLILLVYVAGIWWLKKFAMPLAWIYTGYVVINMALFSMKAPPPKNGREMALALLSLVFGIGVPLAAAIILTRRRPDLA
jgi:hypothetical protein